MNAQLFERFVVWPLAWAGCLITGLGEICSYSELLEVDHRPVDALKIAVLEIPIKSLHLLSKISFVLWSVFWLEMFLNLSIFLRKKLIQPMIVKKFEIGCPERVTEIIKFMFSESLPLDKRLALMSLDHDEKMKRYEFYYDRRDMPKWARGY